MNNKTNDTKIVNSKTVICVICEIALINQAIDEVNQVIEYAE